MSIKVTSNMISIAILLPMNHTIYNQLTYKANLNQDLKRRRLKPKQSNRKFNRPKPRLRRNKPQLSRLNLKLNRPNQTRHKRLNQLILQHTTKPIIILITKLIMSSVTIMTISTISSLYTTMNMLSIKLPLTH